MYCLSKNCCICLSRNADLKELEEVKYGNTNIADIIKILPNMEISLANHMLLICNDCICNFVQFYEFYNKCIAKNRWLLEYISTLTTGGNSVGYPTVSLTNVMTPGVKMEIVEKEINIRKDPAPDRHNDFIINSDCPNANSRTNNKCDDSQSVITEHNIERNEDNPSEVNVIYIKEEHEQNLNHRGDSIDQVNPSVDNKFSDKYINTSPNTTKHSESQSTTDKRKNIDLLIPPETLTSQPSKNKLNKLHFLKKYDGAARAVRRRCKECYNAISRVDGRKAAIKRTKKVVTYCPDCKNQPTLCLQCFEKIHANNYYYLLLNKN